MHKIMTLIAAVLMVAGVAACSDNGGKSGDNGAGSGAGTSGQSQ